MPRTVIRSRSMKGFSLSALFAMIMTTASTAQECIRDLPAKRDVHWYYYVRKSDGAHCWFPGSPGARVVSQDVRSDESKRRSESKPVIKPGPMAAPPPIRKATKAEAATFINSSAQEPESTTPETPAEMIGTRWPVTNANADRSTARREIPQQRREQ